LKPTLSSFVEHVGDLNGEHQWNARGQSS
jgi:hypothetical protein